VLNVQTDSTVQKKKKAHPDIYRKGNFYHGLSLNYSSRDINDLDLVVITVDELNTSGYGFRMDAGYFIQDKWAVGIMGRYMRKDADGIVLNAGEPTTYRSAGEKYSLHLTMKNIFPLGANNRFSVFNYVKAGFSKKTR
jgi:hypothetical protein